MEIQGKIWGKTSVIFERNNIQITRIEGKKGTHCSTHKHDHKFNMFFVERGKLRIRTWKSDYDLIDVTELDEQQSTVVKPGEYHRFEVLEEDTVAFEIYWTQLDNADIKREDCGGRIKQPD